MKKLVAISVLFALLATAVFAQWSNEWKVGFSSRFVTDMFYAAKADGTEKTTTETPSLTTTDTTEYGKYAKGVSHFFPNIRGLGIDSSSGDANIGGDYRMGIRFSNSGENYDIGVSIDVDNTWADDFARDRTSVGQFLTTGLSKTDWLIKGSAGILSAGVGPASADSMAWVGTNAIWGSWIGWSDLNRFGVRRQNGGWIHSDHFRTMDKWGTPFWVGMALGDNFRFNLGYRLDPGYNTWAPGLGSGTDSKSSINASFMLSGKPVDAVTFDLFYTVVGVDNDTFARPIDGTGYTAPETKWKNMVGVYAGINGIENLSLSVGYTANFNVFEAGSYLNPTAAAAAIAAGSADPGSLAQAVTFNAPIYSGIDLRVGYTGIENIGLKFLTNVSLANVKGDKIESSGGNPVYKDKINLLFNENAANAIANAGEGMTQDWFSWHAILRADLGFIDGVGLEVSLGNLLTVDSSTTKYTTTGGGTTYDYSDNTTTNVLRATVGATYGVGNVTLGAALWLGLDSTVVKNVHKTTTAAGTTTTTTDKTDNVVTFGIPVYFQVSF
jgi:hypothetical protein